MSTRKLRDSWWVDFTYHKKRHRIRSPENTRAGAAAHELVLRQRLTRGEPLHGLRVLNPTFREFAEEWFKTEVEPRHKPTTICTWAGHLRLRLNPWFGDRCLSEIDPALIARYIADRKAAGNQPQTVNSHLTVLRLCLREAVERGLLARCPKIKSLDAYPDEKVPLSADEIRLLLSDHADSRWRDAIVVALHTGLRISELLALEWSSVDLRAPSPQLVVRRSFSLDVLTSPKSGKPRVIPLTQNVRDILAARHRNGTFVFPRKDGTPFRQSAAGEALRRRCRRAGIRPIGWHILRHTFSSMLYQAGVGGKAIQDLLGHAQPSTSAIYTHVGAAGYAAAVNALPPLVPFQESRQPAGNGQNDRPPDPFAPRPFLGSTQAGIPSAVG